MELKRYDLSCIFGCNEKCTIKISETPDGEYVKLSDIKEFLGIGECDGCEIRGRYDYFCAFGALWNEEKKKRIRHPDCIKTFGE